MTFRALNFLTCLLLLCTTLRAQTSSPDAATGIATHLKVEGILTGAGEAQLIRRIRATMDYLNGSPIPHDSVLFWVSHPARNPDTVVDISRASILHFLVECVAAEMWYRSGEREKMTLAKALHISGTAPPDPETDSVAFIANLRKLDSVLKLRFPGDEIEHAIPREDPAPPGWHSYHFTGDPGGFFEHVGHGYISPTISVYGKTRSRLIKGLRTAGLVDAAGAAKLQERVRRQTYPIEGYILNGAYDMAVLSQEASSSER